ncbi:MAG: DUF2807 domain-containing protein [Alphaproteobacteria bacterium]|nr:DUF2807 domain-containing protein [Alphaproteobacteria bacterium]
MARTLAVVAFTGLAVAVVSLGAAGAIGKHEFDDGGFDFSIFDGRPACGTADGAGGVREIDWGGADYVDLSVPATVHFHAGDGDRLIVRGEPQTIAHLRVRNGHIEMNCRIRHGRRGDIDITLPGQTFRKFAISGSGKMDLQGLDQDAVKVAISGSGKIQAGGHVDRLDVHIAGSGDADLGNLDAEEVKVHIAGSGNADIAPREKADIHISGSGNVNLHSYPKDMDTHIAGSGHIRNVGGDI